MKAIVMCAGYGTRLGKLTKDTPKPMIEVGGKPVIGHIVDHLNRYGIENIIVNVHYQYQQIVEYLGDRVMYYYEPRLLGERNTEKALSDWLGKNYFVFNGDTLTDLNPLLLYRGRKSMCNGVYTGQKHVSRGFVGDKFYENEEYWIDIGTPEGLEEARRHFC